MLLSNLPLFFLFFAMGVIIALVTFSVWYLFSRPNRPSAVSPTGERGVAKVHARRFMSNAEVSFYHYLKRATNDKWIIALQTPLDCIMKREGRLDKGLYSMISAGHVDFLLLHPRSGEPVVAIELDDSTHSTPSGHDRDRRKDELFEHAGMPLLRFRVGESWGAEGVSRINQALVTLQASGSMQTTANDSYDKTAGTF